MSVVDRYLASLVAHDWDALRDCLAPGVVRIGPFGDTYTPREAYLAFLSGLMPRLPNYSLAVHRVVSAGEVVVAEISETLDVDGAPRETPEALLFDLDGDGRIARITIYTQRPGADVPALAR
jgi:hypothetical protein